MKSRTSDKRAEHGKRRSIFDPFGNCRRSLVESFPGGGSTPSFSRFRFKVASLLSSLESLIAASSSCVERASSASCSICWLRSLASVSRFRSASAARSNSLSCSDRSVELDSRSSRCWRTAARSAECAALKTVSRRTRPAQSTIPSSLSTSILSPSALHMRTPMNGKAAGLRWSFARTQGSAQSTLPPHNTNSFAQRQNSDEVSVCRQKRSVS
mmetsp:Transcript_34094/g.69710  ORF Transcript_34094/g.69710 Transcript_34094/m.69710 type:complete len:213 (-) Transcript_34094:170-808(-)